MIDELAGRVAFVTGAARGIGLATATALGQIIGHECVQRFLRGDQAHFPPADPVYCLQHDLFDFVLVATLENGRLVAKGIDVPKGQPA